MKLPTTERPRDVFLAGCRSIGRELAEAGFKVTKQGQLLRRARGPFVEEIHFQSSHWNELGHVVITPSAAVDRDAFGQWLGSLGQFASKRIAGVNIGHLDGTGWATWDIGDRASREQTLRAIVSAIEVHLLPWLDLVESPEAVEAAARRGRVPGFSVDGVIDYLVFSGRRDAAKEILAAWLAESGARLEPISRDAYASLIDRHDFGLSMPPAHDPSKTFVGRLLARLRSTALANPDIPGSCRDIKRR
jgi:hypothetical protein